MNGGRAGGRRRRSLSELWARHRSRWTLPLVIVVVIILVAVVDHLGAHRISQVDAAPTPPLVAAPGGAATVDLGGPWSGFNPHTPAGATSTTPDLLAPVLPSAFITSGSLQPTLNTALLTSVEVLTTTPLTIRYEINPKAVWSDGTPVTATDFIYAWQAERGGGSGPTTAQNQVASTLGYRDIASVTGSNGGRTVTVVFATPFTDWRILFHELLPAHVAEQVGWNTGFASFSPARVLSAGPYELQSVSGTTTAVLVPNPRWWGTPASLDRIVVHGGTNPTAVLTGGGPAAVSAPLTSPAVLAAITSLPDVQSEVVQSLSFLELDFDTTAAPLTSPTVREGIAHLVNRTTLLAKTVGLVAPSIGLLEDHLSVPGLDSYTASSASGGYDTADPTEATDLLASVGYHRDAAGTMVDSAGTPLSLTMAVQSSDPWALPVARLITAELGAQGIAVTVVPVGGTAGIRLAHRLGTYQLALVQRTASVFTTTSAPWYSTTLGDEGTTGTVDWSNFDDPQVDQLFTQAAQQLNPVTGATIYAQVDDQLWDQMASLPLFCEPDMVANTVTLGGVTADTERRDGLLWNASTWKQLVPKATPRPEQQASAGSVGRATMRSLG